MWAALRSMPLPSWPRGLRSWASWGCRQRAPPGTQTQRSLSFSSAPPPAPEPSSCGRAPGVLSQGGVCWATRGMHSNVPTSRPAENRTHTEEAGAGCDSSLGVRILLTCPCPCRAPCVLFKDLQMDKTRHINAGLNQTHKCLGSENKTVETCTRPAPMCPGDPRQHRFPGPGRG